MNDLKKNDIVYYTKIIPNAGVCEVYELKIRTVKDAYIVGIDERGKHACLFNNEHIGKTVFKNRRDALKVIEELKKNKNKSSR